MVCISISLTALRTHFKFSILLLPSFLIIFCYFMFIVFYSYFYLTFIFIFVFVLYLNLNFRFIIYLGGFIPQLAEVCLAAVNAFNLPCAINMYITNAGQKTSAPPHTDKQVTRKVQSLL